MDMLKKIFPLSFKYVKDIKDLIIGILLYIVGIIVGGLIIGLVGGIIPLIGYLFGSLIELYVVAGIVIQLLVFFKVIKD